MKTPLVLLAFGTLALGAATGCGSSAPTAELKSAREALAQAKESNAAKLTPDKVLEAEQALDKAEKAHREEPQSDIERHFAYLAERRAQIAVIHGEISDAEAKKAAAEERYVKLLDERRRKAESTAARTSGELEKERAARILAEQKLNAALKSLEEIAKVKEESRGVVITLSGGVLFASGKSELLPIAKDQLDQVAVALQNTDPSQKIVVEGHTDSVGPDQENQKLSEDRARAVRDHLVSKGVEPNRISFVGRGEANPVSDNTSAEGRANNRRVEIVVSPKAR